MKRIIVTGGTGFIGRNCVPLLSELGYDIHVISSHQRVVDEVKWHTIDLMDPAAVSAVVRSIRPSHLLHLAWITEPCRYATAPENLDWLIASLHLTRVFHEVGGERVVMSGSCAEYDWTSGLCSEQATPLNPSTFYGQCKNSLQSSLAAYARQVGLSWAWGRLFFLYGPHGHPARIPGVVIESLLQNKPALCSHGNQIRDFLHVSDAASALTALLDGDVQGPVNIASGERITIREMVLQIADRIGRRDLVQFGAVPASPSDPPLLVADVKRLQAELDWHPMHTLDTGLDATLRWRKGELHGSAV
ncbi:MAG: NAD(P)-dependent oxidoreductase [Planctomycetes bacterium]|nr:NAD(P)-dependent oxidoreductase [Planctomycetota bacterium]